MTKQPPSPSGRIVYNSLHAPKENGGALIDPPMGEFAERILSAWGRPLIATRVCWHGKDALSSRIVARIDLLRTLGFGKETLERPLHRPIIMVGHQPQLFHPGVWVKNFITDRIARSVQGDPEYFGIAVNLVVDNDLMKSTSIAIPTNQERMAMAHVAFDAAAEEMPYEERRIIDRELAASFADRVLTAMPPQESAPLIASFWREVMGQAKETNHWGEVFSIARNTFERQWGIEIYDVPLSRLVHTHSFARLALEIMHDAHGFATIYNAALAEYREVHGLRSRSHPAPDLEIVSENEVELPFWLWTGASPRRKRTFIHRRDEGFYIADREGLEWPGSFDEGQELVTRMMAEVLSPSNTPTRPKLRPKALITTLFARAFLCDGFVHGIGGAKYDQVTEAIAARWGLGELAPMQCATMTLRLPLGIEVISEEEVRRRKRALRELVYHGEKFLAQAELSAEDRVKADALADEKRKWVANTDPASLHERHLKIGAINRELYALLSPLRARLESAYADALAQFAAQQPWLSREFPAVLFPEEYLRKEMRRAAQGE